MQHEIQKEVCISSTVRETQGKKNSEKRHKNQGLMYHITLNLVFGR